MATVTLDAMTAAWLTASALDHIWCIVQDEDAITCCPGCCGTCGAIRQMDDAGQLDQVIHPYAALLASEVWSEAGEVDRRLLARAWAKPCEMCGWAGKPWPNSVPRLVADDPVTTR